MRDNFLLVRKNPDQAIGASFLLREIKKTTPSGLSLDGAR
jgi:hypothetical protein